MLRNESPFNSSARLFPQNSVQQLQQPFIADHSFQPLKNETIQGLLERVDMKGAFLGLAKNDEALV